MKSLLFERAGFFLFFVPFKNNEEKNLLILLMIVFLVGCSNSNTK